MSDEKSGQSGGVNISGGSGNISVGGDVVGRDKVTTTTTTITYGIGGDQLAQLMQGFKQVNDKIDKLPDKDEDEKQELKETVKKIEEEVKKGEEAKPEKVERWLKFVAGMSNDILQVTAATLTNPVAGVAKAVQLIAQKAQQEAK